MQIRDSRGTADLASRPADPTEADPSVRPLAAEPSMATRAIHGSLWTAVRFVAEYGLRMISSLILTRLLVPEAFGLMALISVLMTGLAMFSDMGISSSVVQSKRGDDPAYLNTAWTLQVIRGFVLWIFAALFADAMAVIYVQPELRVLILAAALTTIVAGFNSVGLLQLRRHIEIKKLALIDVSGQLLTGLATVAWAWYWPSVWALVWGGLMGAVAKLLISHWASGSHRCRFAWDAPARADLLGFGKWIFLSTILFFLAGQADRLIFGRLLTVSTLGIFSIAVTLAAIPTQVVWQIGHAILFPALSRRSHETDGFRHVYLRSLRPLLVLGALPVACLGAGGPELVEVLYDPRYAAAGWMLQILAVGAWFQIPQASSGSAVLALGRPWALALSNGAKFAGLLLFLPLGYWQLGLAGAIAGVAAAELVRYAALAIAVRRVGLPGIGTDLAMTGIVAGLVAAGLVAAQWAGRMGGGALGRLFASAAVIGSLWLPVSLFVLRSEVPRVLASWNARRERAQLTGVPS